jgi:hypothetical protein
MFCLQSVIFVKETIFHHFLETRLYYRQLILVNINCSRSRNSGRGNRQCRLDCRPAVLSGRQKIYEFAYVKLEPKWKADRRCNNLALPTLLHSHVVENLSLPTCFRTASILGRENLYDPGSYDPFSMPFFVCVLLSNQFLIKLLNYYVKYIFLNYLFENLYNYSIPETF